MRKPNEIQIFVSNPNDVNLEKQIIIDVCDRINNKLATIECDVRYLVKEWEKAIGKFGINPQEEIESLIGNYDVYFGIWWKKFGSETGIINPETGHDFGSGTYREFCLAYGNLIAHNKPEIYLFFKKEPGVDFFNKSVHTELGKIIDFEKAQQPNGFCNSFENERDFERKITDLLWSKATQICMGFKIENVQFFLDDAIKLEIGSSQPKVKKIPEPYIIRTTSHFSFFKERQNIPFLELEKQSLVQLVFSKPRIVVLGDAGSGKSTELISLFHTLNQEDSQLIPLFQNLNSYTPEEGIEKFLPEVWEKIPENLLLIIWDGLDEIQPEHFNTVVRQINTFSEKHKEIKIIISCRTNFYELPLNNSTGTLPGFEPYLINDILVPDAIEYYRKKYSGSQAENFIKEVFDSNASDLMSKPFFLMLLADQFAREQKLSLNKAELYELFLLNRIKIDQNHFKTTIDLRSKKKQIIKLLQRMALAMEVLSKNQIKESEVLELVTSDEFNSLKYCTVFKKKDGEEDTWQFEYNNIQEFLAAKALSGLEFDKVIKFIAFEPKYEKLIPSWVNTLAFLFSILNVEDELFKQLLEWMLKYEKEVIVRFEPDKITEDIRIQIFQGIFNHYKKHDVWINSNKFNDKDLAEFAQSESNLRFLIDQLKDEENSKTVKTNAIRILGHLKFGNKDIQIEIEDLLLEQIKINLNDPNFIHSVIYALKWAGLTRKNTIKNLMGIISSQKNQYVRSAMYAILLKSEALEVNVEYLIEGYELIDKKIKGERSEVSLLDESWNLNECVKNLKSPEALKKIIEYIAESTRYEYGYDSGKVLEAIISNAVVAYNKDNTVFDSILGWLQKDIKGFRMEKTNLILSFFDQTKTREKAFYQIWQSIEDKERNKSSVIAKLINPELMLFIIDEYLNHNLTNKELENIFFNMSWVGNTNQDKFEELIHEETNIIIRKPERIDYESLRKAKLKQNFDLLFDKRAFIKATLNIFESQGKEILSFDELFEIKKDNYSRIDLEESDSGVALKLLRDFIAKGQSISKVSLMSWFEKKENEEWYRISQIYEYLTNHREIEINEEQKHWIANWCRRNVTKVNFKKAIEVQKDGKTTYKTMAIYIWYLSRRFKIENPKDVLLDMLSFDFIEGNDWVGIEYLVTKLDHNDIVNRMLDNIKDGIDDNAVLKNHIKYLSKYKVEESYPFILNELNNTKRIDYHRKELLDIFFEFTKSTETLKSIIDKTDSFIKWEIIEKLKANNEELYVEEYLLNAIDKYTDSVELGNAAEVLVGLQNIRGLKIYVDCVKNNISNEMNIRRVMSLNSLKSIDAIPYLLELLELSYLKEIKVDQFDSFNSHVLGAFYNIALVSEENFTQVKLSLGKFMNKYSSIQENVKYILHTIERMEDQFYMNRAQSYSIKQVKEKLKLL